MRHLRPSALVTLSLIHAAANAQTAPHEKIDISKIGPQVGERVPDFNLRDQYGSLQTLRSIMGPKGAMLVFIRSADWCPYCKTQLLELQANVAETRRQGLGLAAISYDPPDVIAGFARQHSITYTMLSDPGSATIRRFRVLNPLPVWAQEPGSKDDPVLKEEIRKYVSVISARASQVGMAFPGTLILDPEGRVRQRHFEESYVERNTVSNLLIKSGGVAGAAITGTKVSTAHIDVTTYPSTGIISAGERFSVVLDVVPHAGIHVYAPGARNYRVIALKIDPTPEFRILPVEYPSSEIYFFKALNEKVPVFQRPFRLVQELVLIGTPEAQAALKGRQSVTAGGSLEYQACDDRQCFNPVTVPLSWTLNLNALVTEPTIRSGN
jgi:peroxiredoxin